MMLLLFYVSNIPWTAHPCVSLHLQRDVFVDAFMSGTAMEKLRKKLVQTQNMLRETNLYVGCVKRK